MARISPSLRLLLTLPDPQGRSGGRELCAPSGGWTCHLANLDSGSDHLQNRCGALPASSSKVCPSR